MADDGMEKSEEPTSRKLEEATEQGNVPDSKEMGTFFAILAALVLLYFFGNWMFIGMGSFMSQTYSNIGAAELTPEGVVVLFTRVALKLAVILAPAFLIMPFFAIAGKLMQNGIIMSSKSITPDITKINPIAGLKNLFSPKSLVELVKSIGKVSIVAYVVYGVVSEEWLNLPLLMDMELVTAISFTADLALRIIIRTVWVLALIGFIDYLYQRYTHKKGLRMSKEEVKEEHKESEGDPLVKARIRTVQRQLARQRMMQDVPEADFVVTNPTHLAVAVKYNKEKNSAPMVVAKGAGLIAERIKEIAKENGIPVIENKPLARSLFKFVEIGMEIPETLYKAVAEMLAYIYGLKKKKQQ
ncbi:Flagellar biosynthesis protein FlhB [hydrothermal vent metagenome]|uniref:Flagellar biosynthetic protein FlhB n=1 Tax=hydrothermal vent metagenome TaxID=652676 RepID=A0A3B0UU92_9ZZZZ